MLEETKQPETEEPVDFLDEVLGGESHSPEEDGKETVKDPEPEEGTETIPDDDLEDGLAADSIEERERLDAEDDEEAAAESGKQAEAEAEADRAKIEAELENYRKRLHDTQSAMHRATSEKARLQKELDELKKKQTDEDDWFGESDKERVTELESDLKKTDEEITRCNAESKALQDQSAQVKWDAAAETVKKAHPDFEKVCYDELVPLMEKNAQVKAEFDALADKSPASVYAFAVRQLDIQEFQRDPEAYKARLRGTKNQPNRPETDSPLGKDGLDMIPDAGNPEGEPDSDPGRVSFVDEVFG